jgi:PAS domain S-box-containing protein
MRKRRPTSSPGLEAPDASLDGPTRVRRASTVAPSRDAPSHEVDPRALLHELEVHQLELEMQNEELLSARNEAENALARYTELFDFAPIGYATLGIDGCIREVNHAGAQVLGLPRSRLIGMAFSAALAREDRAAFKQLLDETKATGQKQACELTLAKSGTRPKHLHVTATLLVHDAPTSLIAFEDVTERKQREEKLARTELALREADRRKDEFLAVLSHELRNPLAPIRNSLFVLAHSEPGGKRAKKAEAVIDRQVTHLTRLVDDLLDVTRIAHGKIELQRKPVELASLVRRTLEDHRTSFDAMGIALVGEFDPEPAWVDADSARLVQALSNLLGNALKFTPRGGRVLVTLENIGRHVALRVSDNGAGIARSVIDNLFVPFSQAPQSADRARGGLGLGLAMVKGLVKLHGGNVSISSPGLGLGTRVEILLPLREDPEEQPQSTEPLSVRSRRVLVIEDHPDTCEALGDALALSGHQVRTAHDGPHGLDVAREFVPEVVICDIGLPGMDGYGVAKAFSADPQLQHAALIALSGYAQPEDLRRASNAGFHCHLAKPASLDGIQRALAEAARIARTQAMK